MTIQVKFFANRISDTYEGFGGAIKQMENEMNDFLKDLRDDDVKDISIVLGNTQRMGLVVYRDNIIESENEIKIDVDQYSTKNPPPGYSSKEWGIVEKMIADKAFDD